MEKFVIRRFTKNDSIKELVRLLHRAYKRLADMGLYFVACDISEEEMQSFADEGECFVAECDGKIIGSILLYPKGGNVPEFYRRDDVAIFGKFAVEPEFQEKGIGETMMNYIEEYVGNKGIKELACDTSEQAHHLISYYTKRGYRFIGYQKWNRTNYRSVILSKTIG